MPELDDLSCPEGQAWRKIQSWIYGHENASDQDIRVSARKAYYEKNLEIEQLIEVIRTSPDHANSPEGRRLIRAFEHLIT